MAIDNEKDLAKALNEEQDSIEIEGDLANKVVRIKATGTVAWAIAIGAIGLAIVATVGTGGAAAPAAGVVGAAATGVLGVSATAAAVAIAVAAGGVGVLNTLRSYEIVNSEEGRVTLKRT